MNVSPLLCVAVIWIYMIGQCLAQRSQLNKQFYSGNCGGQVVMECSGSSVSSFRFQQNDLSFIDNNINPYPSKYSTVTRTESVQLTIRDIEPSDEGRYRSRMGFDALSEASDLRIECKATAVSVTVQPSKHLQVSADRLYPNNPTISLQLDNVSSSTSPASCVASADPDYYKCTSTTTQCLNEGIRQYRVIVTTRSDSQTFTGSLIIVSPRRPVISNTVTISDNTQALSGKEGQMMTLICTSNGGYPTPTVSWYVGSVHIDNRLNFLNTGILQTDGTYTVRLTYTFTPQRDDDGSNLTCQSSYPDADTECTTDDQTSAILYLYYPPSSPTFEVNNIIVDTPCPIEVVEGAQLSVKCVSSDNPISQQFIWTRPDLTINSGQQLEIQNVNASGGNIYMYTCTVVNTVLSSIGALSIESRSSSLVVVLLVSPRPSAHVPIVTNILVEINTSATLSFMAVAYPFPERSGFVWYRCSEIMCTELFDGNSTNISIIGLMTNLTIRQVEKTDFGRYKLIVSNGIGQDFEQGYLLTQQDKPTIPTEFDYIDESRTESSVTLLWNKGFNGGLPQTFVIQYKPISGNDQWSSIEVADKGPRDISFITLTNLRSDTEYTARIFAYNAVNRSDFTEEIIFKTTIGTNIEDPSPPVAIIGGTVGGCVGVAVIIVVVVAVLLIRKRRLGIPKMTSNESAATTYMELNVTSSAGNVYDPIQPNDSTEQADARTEPPIPSTNTGQSHHGNPQSTYGLDITETGEDTANKAYENA